MITDRSPGAASRTDAAPAAPAAAVRRRSGSTLLAVVVVGLLIGAVPLPGWWAGRAALDRARPGDWLTFGPRSLSRTGSPTVPPRTATPLRTPQTFFAPPARGAKSAPGVRS